MLNFTKKHLKKLTICYNFINISKYFEKVFCRQGSFCEFTTVVASRWIFMEIAIIPKYGTDSSVNFIKMVLYHGNYNRKLEKRKF